MEYKEHLDAFLDYINSQRRYSKYTARNYSKAVLQWCVWLESNEMFSADIFSVDRVFAKNYVAFLSSQVERRTLHNKVSALRSFHKFLARQNPKARNPFEAIPLPKAKKDLPIFLSENQIPKLLKSPFHFLEEGKISRQEAIRDSLCLELLYGAGLRISELCSLKFENIDFEKASARVLGKGNKIRLCPFGEVALEVLKTWRDEFRAGATRKDFVLTSQRGSQMYPRLVQRNLKKYLIESNLPLDITPHKLRHTFATHLVDGGIDLRALQEMLGHSSLSTTQIYTHLGTSHLKKEHSKLFD